MFCRCLNKNRGSFLLEALIAVTILAVSLAVIVRSHLGALQAQVFAKDYTLATLLLEREMIELVENGYIDKGISEERTLEKPYERFTFVLKTAAAGQEYYFDKLNEVQAALSWTSGQKTHTLSASTLISTK
jgi:hypothetical protein